ncbi:hypothetical protein L1987_58348 [Smallanthus sonchifolius]|uniref:Uncharacterized protein n=1 Tax=Smallanthus sonchifolius TaxID=185202 RepID=A0ACB9DFN9_9ASTR|nr:hypothetical protein L1987_58348 [Smallanthus sonchifolius]
MTYTGAQMFMEKLKQLINCNHIPLINNPTIIRERPPFQLLYQELGSISIDEHQNLEKVNGLGKRFTDAVEKAQYMSISFYAVFALGIMEISLNLDDVRRSLESVKVEFISMRTNNMKMDSSPRPEKS